MDIDENKQEIEDKEPLDNKVDTDIEVSKPAIPEEDFYLKVLSYMANVNKISFPISLSVNGILITGFTVSRDEWLQNLVKSMRINIESLNDDLRNYFEDEYFKPLIAPIDDENEEWKIENISYIHIRRAQIMNTGSLPIPNNAESSFWRGRISEVSGFSFGAYQVNKQQS